MSYIPLPQAWVYRDGKPVPLVWCSRCHSFHVSGEHGSPKLTSVKLA